LEQQCTQETKLINDMLALRKLESNPAATAQFHKLDLKFLIRDLAFNLAESWSDKDLELVVDLPTQPLSIYTDPDSLNRIVVELLTNAKKYSAPGTTLHLKVFHEVQPQMSQVVLSLSSVGFGISPEEQPYIFEKFRRGEWATKQAIQGTGLGLALVKGLVGHLNGAIAVTSEPMSQGPAWCTCFTVTLPQYPERVILAGPL
jgi:signal transduction histidine kinase